MSTIIELDSVSRSFGGVFATRDVSLTVKEGELRGLIGPNGAGKSTLFNLVSGHLRPSSGSIKMDSIDIQRLPSYKRAKHGIATVFQGARLFDSMSVLENVMVGAHARTRAGIVSALLRVPKQRAEEKEIVQSSREALGRVGLSGWEDRPATSLPLGQQRRLQVARALVARPRLLLLDEPASGLRADEREDFSLLVEQLHEEGMTIMLIEHDVAMVTRLSDRITVLELGAVIAEGTPDEIRRNARVIEAYLGEEHSNAHSA